MDDLISFGVLWMTRSLIVGGAVLAFCWVLARLIGNLAIRQCILAGSVRAAVFASLFCLIPSWLLMPTPDWLKRSQDTAAIPINHEKISNPANLDHSDNTVDHGEPINDWPNEEFVPLPANVIPMMSTTFDNGNLSASGKVVREIHRPDLESKPETMKSAATANPTTPKSNQLSIGAMVFVFYLIGAVVLLGQYLLGVVVLHWVSRRGARIPLRSLQVWQELIRNHGIKPRLIVSDWARSAVCFGYFRPTIVVPRSLVTSAEPNELRWVLAHELDHLQRGDHRTRHWLAIARALFFIYPWFWSIRRSLELSQEFLADYAASNGRSLDYATFLVNLSGTPAERRWVAYPKLVTTGVRAGHSDLFRRIQMLVSWKDDGIKHVGRGWKAMITLSVIGSTILLSGLGFARTQDAPDAPKPKPEEPKRTEKSERKEKPDQPKEVDRKLAEMNYEIDRAQAKAMANVQTLKSKIEQAIKDGDAATARKLLDQLEKELKNADAPRRNDPPRVGRPGEGDAPRVVRPGEGEAPRVVRPGNENPRPLPPREGDRPEEPKDRPMVRPIGPPMGGGDIRSQYERQLKEIEDAMNRLKDDPESRMQLEKARDEFKRAMEQSLKAADALRDNMRDLKIPVNPLGAGFPMIEGFPGIENFPGVEGFPNVQVIPGGFGGSFTINPALRNGMFSPKLGVQLDRLSPVLIDQLGISNKVGVVIANVRKDSAADKAGIKPNDILIELNGKEVSVDPREFNQTFAYLKSGEKVNAVVLRKGKKETIKDIEISEPVRQPGFGRGAPAINNRMSMRVQDGAVTIDANVDGVEYTIVGEMQDNKVVPSKIRIKDGEKTIEAESLDKVPESYRNRVDAMLNPSKFK